MTALHLDRKTIFPDGRDPTSGPENKYCFCWSSFKSPTAQDLTGTESRSIAWAPGDLYQTGRKVCVYWTFRPLLGSFGRGLNFHSNPKRGGWNPDGTVNSYVSAVALDWYGGSNPLKLSLAAHNWREITVMTSTEIQAALAAKSWLDFVLEIEIGRLDETTKGNVKVWVNGEDAPRVNSGQTNTFWKNQTGYALWEGMYHSNGVPSNQSAEFVCARVGRSHAEAQNDGAGSGGITEQRVWGSVKRSDSSQNAYTHEVLGTRDTSLFRVPPSLGGPEPTPNELTLRKVSETADKITLGWDWVPEDTIGFRYQSALSAPKWSHTWDSSRRAVTFAKADWYDVQALTVGDSDRYP